MTRLRAVFARLVDLGLVAFHRFLGLVRGPAVQVIITGPDSSSVDYLVRELHHKATRISIDLGPQAARETQGRLSAMVTTHHIGDLISRDDTIARVGRFRQIVVVSLVDDPRQLVCARWPETPHQWPVGFDYSFGLAAGGTKSFTEPGVLPWFEGLREWQDTPGVSVISANREQLERDPAALLLAVADSLPRARRRGKGLWKQAATTVTPLAPSVRWWDTPETASRVVAQVSLAPELEALALEYGYPARATLSKKRAPQIQRGTIIAFHTPDEVYRAEAARLKSTLDALGLKYHFFEVTPEKNWVRTTLLKPSWIMKAREELKGPLLYIDVDAFVHKDPWPYLRHYDADVAAVVYHNGQLNSATVWINDTPGARVLLQEWNDRAVNRREADSGDLEATGDNGDQGVLKLAVLAEEKNPSGAFTFQRLPVNMAYIFDRTETYCVGPVVIEQLQVSRESLGHDKRLARRRERLLQLDAEVTRGS